LVQDNDLQLTPKARITNTSMSRRVWRMIEKRIKQKSLKSSRLVVIFVLILLSTRSIFCLSFMIHRCNRNIISVSQLSPSSPWCLQSSTVPSSTSYNTNIKYRMFNSTDLFEHPTPSLPSTPKVKENSSDRFSKIKNESKLNTVERTTNSKTLMINNYHQLITRHNEINKHMEDKYVEIFIQGIKSAGRSRDSDKRNGEVVKDNLKSNVNEHVKLEHGVSKKLETLNRVKEMKLLKLESRSEFMCLIKNYPVGTMSIFDVYEMKILLKEWRHRVSLNSGRMSEMLLNRLVEEELTGNTQARCDTSMYAMTINSWITSGDSKAEQQATEVLNTMGKRADIDLKLYAECHSLVIDAWSKSKKKNAAEKAETILEQMESLKCTLDENMLPKLADYKAVLKAWGKSRKTHAGKRADKIFNRMIDFSRNEDNCNLYPDQFTYNLLMKVWAKSREKESSKRAEEILQMMETQFLAGDKNSEPDIISYTTVINALARNGGKNAAKRAEDILYRMNSLSEKGQLAAKPDTMAWNTVLSVYSTGNMPRAGRKCEKLLMRMEHLCIDNDSNAKPDTCTFNSVLNAYANSCEEDATRKAEKLLKRMEKLYANGDKDLKPDITTYNTVLKVYANNANVESMHNAEKLLRRLEENNEKHIHFIKPDTVSYNTVIAGWANSGMPLGARNAENLLNRMSKYALCGNKNAQPDTTTYNSVINAWSKTQADGSAQRAESYLQHMIDLHMAGMPNVRPDIFSFTSVMNAYSKSFETNKARKANSILHRLEFLHKSGDSTCEPNIVAYGTVLNACAHTRGTRQEREEAFLIAVAVMRTVRNSSNVTPNHVIYGSFLKACVMLMTEDDVRREPMIERVFRQCCKDGQVSERIWTLVKDAASLDLYERLINFDTSTDNWVGSFEAIPREWKSNVKENKRWQRNRRIKKA